MRFEDLICLLARSTRYLLVSWYRITSLLQRNFFLFAYLWQRLFNENNGDFQ